MKRVLLTLLCLPLVSCGGSDPAGTTITCGTGTVEMDGVCVPDGTPPPDGLTCGTGTHEANGECVPDGQDDVGIPTITAITPGAAGISGGTVFAIDGTNFAGQGAGNVTVKFGDQAATIAAVTPNRIAGVIPPGVSIDTTVTVTTDKGSVTTSFEYLAIYAADGRGLDNGFLYLIDPTNGFWGVIDILTDATDANTTYGLTGLAFDGNGTLFGTTAAGLTKTSQLVTVDPQTAKVTVIGTLTDGNNEHHIADIKFDGATLYGHSGIAGLVTIDPTTAAVTPVATNGFAFGGGMVFDDNNNLLAANLNVNAGTMDLNSVDTTTGAETTIAALDYGVFANQSFMPNAMASIQGVIVGSFDNSTTGNNDGTNEGTDLLSSRSMVKIDPATGATSWLAEMPALEGFVSQIDAIATAPATVVIAHDHPIAWNAPPARDTSTAMARVAPTTVTVRGAAISLGHHQAMSLATLGASRVTAADGTSLDVDGTAYTLIGTRRGGLKLVDASGRVVMRHVATIE